MIVDKFLCCLKLEFCALFFGWFGVIATSVFMVVVTIVGAMTLLDFEDMRELLIRKAEDFDLGFGVDIVSYILTSRWTVLIFLIISAVQSVFGLHMNVQMIRAAKNKNPKPLRTLMVMVGIGGLLSFFMLFPISWMSVVKVALSIVIHIYLIVCVYSTYAKFKNSRKLQLTELNKN